MKKTLGFLLLGGGGLWIAYELGWLCAFGFGPSCSPAAAPPTPPATPPTTPPTTTAPPPTTPPAPTTPPPGSVSFSLVGPVAPDINNSIKGQVSIAGSVQTINLLPDGSVYNTSGQDITATITAKGVDPQAILSAMQAALQAQTVVAGADIPPCTALPRAITSYQSAGLTDPQSVLRLAQLQAALAKCPAGTSGLAAYMTTMPRPKKRRSLYAIHGASRINYRRVA